ncbi:MAG: hypothetical protein AAF968_16740 [Pseudomonadota bacterium]
MTGWNAPDLRELPAAALARLMPYVRPPERCPGRPEWDGSFKPELLMRYGSNWSDADATVVLMNMRWKREMPPACRFRRLLAAIDLLPDEYRWNQWTGPHGLRLAPGAVQHYEGTAGALSCDVVISMTARDALTRAVCKGAIAGGIEHLAHPCLDQWRSAA